MSQLKKSKLISQISIAAQIVDGSIKIDSIEEFDNILKLFPDSGRSGAAAGVFGFIDEKENVRGRCPILRQGRQTFY
jgi:hypothetical protein